MSRYVLTQEQLDRLQEQINELSRLNDIKEQRIKNLEVHKVRIAESGTADLIKTIEKLEQEVAVLKDTNKRLSTEIDVRKGNESKIKELELLLQEERKLREYSEAFAQQVELKCAEESLIRELTTELCQLQRDEIEIDNKRILELQKKLKSLGKETDYATIEKTKKQMKTPEKNYKDKSENLKNIIKKLEGQLIDLYNEMARKPATTAQDLNQRKELELWLREIHHALEDVDDIEALKKDLNYLKNKIETIKESVRVR